MARTKQRLAFLRSRGDEGLPGLLARVLLAVAGAVGLSLCVASAYGLPIPLWQAALVSALSCLFFLVTLASRKLGLLATGLFCALSLFALSNTALLHRLARSFVYLYNAVLLRLDSEQISSAPLMTLAAAEAEQNAAEGAPAALIALVLLSFLSAVFLNGRVRLLPFGLIAGLLLAAPFASDHVPALWQWGLLLAAMVGAYAVRACRVTAKPYRAAAPSVKASGLRRYGAPGILAALICAAAVALSSALLPEGTHFVREDLYERAEELAFRIGDRIGRIAEEGISLNGLPQMFRKDSYADVMGFRSDGSISIAAPRVSEREVLLVETDVAGPVYLRAGVGATFDGSTWKPPAAPQELADYPAYLQPWELSLTGLAVPVDFEMGEITLTYLTPTDAFLLPLLAEGAWPADARPADDGAALLSSLRVPEPFAAQLYALRHRTDLFEGYEDYRNEYRAEMEAYAGEGGIYFSPAYDAYVRERYLDVPAWLLPELEPLAASLTEGYEGDYEKAVAVCAYLYENFAYSLEPQESSRGLDDVRCFLFESRRGHCALYASSMALLLRAEGIPARYATGFAADTGGTSSEILRERDYHAWTEVYFEGVGWLPFDPTGIAASPDAAPETASPVETTPPPTETTAVSPPLTSAPSETPAPAVPERRHGSVSAWLVPAAVLLLLTGAGALGLRRLRRAERAARTLRTRGNPGRASALLYDDILRLLAAEGLIPRPGELFSDFARRADAAAPLAGASLEALAALFERREFGRGTVTDKERRSVLAYRDTLMRVITDKRGPWGRLRLRLRLLKAKSGR